MNKLIVLAVVALSCGGVFAEEISPQRVEALAPDAKSAWQVYLDRSKAHAASDEAALQAELKANALATPLAAPNGGDFKMSAKPGDAWFATDEAKQLAEIILSYQTPSGGWSKHTGYSAGPRKPGMLWSSQYKPGSSPHYLCTFDNRSTTEQLHFLAYAWHATKREEYKAAFERGIDFVLDAQYPTGGWPQVYPLEGGYHDNITFNDDAMTRVLGLLKAITDAEPYYAFVDDARRQRVASALDAGVKCLLAAQIEVKGKKTVWCAQHDPITLAATNARGMEPATLSGMESARILELLMRFDKPSPEIIASIESGLAWFDSAKITGIARKTVNGKTTYEPDPASTEVYWARFYHLTEGHPVFPGRDSVLYATYAEMAQGNEIGYDYYTTLPNSLVTTKQAKWRKAMNK